MCLPDVSDMTYDELLALARRFEHRELETVTGRKFTVGVSRAENCPFFTPASSGSGVTRNASHLVALLANARPMIGCRGVGPVRGQ